MKPAVLRLAVAALLFAGWIGYLFYLVLTQPPRGPDGWWGVFFPKPEGRPLLLSRPQFLVSELDVVAEVPDEGDKITVDQVLYPPEEEGLRGKTLTVINLDQCRSRTADGDTGPPSEWTGPGRYLLPLRRPNPKKDEYEVVPIPPSAGYPPAGTLRAVGPPRIYPAGKQVLAQYHQIRKAE
jgi:hypothetical protein